MKQNKGERIKLLEGLRAKMNELKEAGREGIVSLNVTKPKKMKEQVVSKVSEITLPPQEEDSSNIKKGKIKWFSVARGYGFVGCEDDGEDYFLHYSNITGDVSTGDRVTFQSKHTSKGLEAVGVTKQLQEKKP